MSIATDRIAIAAAASIADVTCSPYYRQSLSPGSAAVQLSVMNRADNGFGFMCIWQIWVALAQDERAAEKWMDDHLETFTAALAGELVVTSITPTTITAGDGAEVNGLVIEGARALT